MFHFPTLNPSTPLKVAIGAGTQSYPGWISTQREQLDLLDPECWRAAFAQRKADAFLCEHVWEHLTHDEGRRAARYCFEALKPGGYIRCAVPDRNFRDEAYQREVGVGGPGPADHPAADHKIVYDFRLFAEVFKSAGFEIDLLEYCDDDGRFHYNQWSIIEAPIYRSLLSDHRNKAGSIGFVSLIIDARKPLGSPASPSDA
jgi:predicted SAM-dependent methyltransferase